MSKGMRHPERSRRAGVPALKSSAVALSTASPRTPGLRAGVAAGFPLQSLTRRIRELAFLCLPLSLAGQSPIPSFESNTTQEQRAKSVVVSNLECDSITVIAYYTQCYWSTKQSYRLLISDHGSWHQVQWVVTYSNRDKNKIKHISKKKLPLARQVDSLITDLNALGFWSLGQDSLNISEKQLNDTTMSSINISDGCSQVIEVLSGGHQRILSAYEPEQLQAFVHIPSRGRFIQCVGAIRKTLFAP